MSVGLAKSQARSWTLLRPGLSQATVEEATGCIVDVVDGCLDVLGESGKFACIEIMKTQHGLPIGQVPYDPREFVKVLRELLGYAATVLEQRMLEELSALSYHDEATSECLRNFASVLKEDLGLEGLR